MRGDKTANPRNPLTLERIPTERMEAKVILSRLPPVIQYLQSGWKPYLILVLMLGLTWVALAVRGFTLGFYGDVVAYQFHYRFDGVIGGMNWLIVEHWQRHLLGALFSAPLHILAPGRYDLWYALALGLHLMLGPVVFLLVDALQSGRRHWLAFGTALFFVFDTLQTPSNIEFATGSHRKAALILAALSLWSYIHFVRSQRQQLGWYMFNIATFILAIMTYEQSLFFFVLHPVIAFVIHRRIGSMVFALMMEVLLAPGISFLYEHQAVHLAKDKASSQVFQTIFDAIPQFADEAEPYLLSITDRYAEEELALHPRDVNFPHVFALHYGIREFRADAVLHNDDKSQKIQQIQLRDEGIISPLSPHEAIGYDRVVVVSYDSRSSSAAILDRLPDDALRRGNFEIHADMPIETNWALLP